MVDAFDRDYLFVIWQDGSRWHGLVDESSKLVFFRDVAAGDYVKVDCVVVVRLDHPQSNEAIGSKCAAHRLPHLLDFCCRKNLVDLDRD